jgi:hypothetical protein
MNCDFHYLNHIVATHILTQTPPAFLQVLDSRIVKRQEMFYHKLQEMDGGGAPRECGQTKIRLCVPRRMMSRRSHLTRGSSNQLPCLCSKRPPSVKRLVGHNGELHNRNIIHKYLHSLALLDDIY